MKKNFFKSIALTCLLAVSSISCITAASAAPPDSDGKANIYISDTRINESASASDSPTLTANVGDIIEINVAVAPTGDITDFAALHTATYFNQNDANSNDISGGNNILGYTDAYYGNPTFYKTDNIPNAIILTNPATLPSERCSFAYTYVSPTNSGDFSKTGNITQFTLKVNNAGDCYITTVLKEATREYETNDIRDDVSLLATYTTATVVGHTDEPIEEPTDEPSETPTDEPTDNPSEIPTDEPTNEPTDEPSEIPTDEPSETPSETPSENPTDAPSENPTEAPTDEPTNEPSDVPTDKPTDETTDAPTDAPSEIPTDAPTDEPSENPTDKPSETPSETPTDTPSENPTDKPSENPTGGNIITTGDDPETPIKKVEPTNPTNSITTTTTGKVATGDTAPLAILGTLAIISAGVVATTLLLKKRKTEK